MDLARFEEAAAVLEDVFFEATRIGEDELASQVAFQLVHIVTFGLGEPERAMEWDRHAVTAMRRAGLDPYASERLWASRGTVYEAMGRYEAALKAYRMVLRLDSDTGADSYRDQTHTDIANVLSRLGRLDQAAQHYQKSVDMSTEVRGPIHAFTIRSRVNLASSFAEREMWDEAERELDDILDILADNEMSEHELLEAAALDIQGVVFSEQGDAEAALEAFERALPLEEALYGSDHLEVSGTLTNIATAAARLHRCEEARSHALRALAIAERNGGPDTARAAHLSLNVAAAYRCDEQFEDALPHDRRAASLYERLQPGSSEASEAWDRVAIDLDALGRGAEAAQARRQAGDRAHGN
jgi:tetratricopeptide (TPR) repeat protein